MSVFRRFSNLFRRSHLDREIQDELQAHIDLRTDANIAAGMSLSEARRDALLRFGNPASTRERVASADAALGLSGLWRDTRYAARQLRKSPGFTLTVIATLSIGIGANVAVFSSMDAVVLHPLAVPDLDRVVSIAEEQQQRGSDAVALADFEDWKRQSHSFEDLAVRRTAQLTLSGAGDAAQVQASYVSSRFFSVLRTRALLGRLFADAEYQPGRDRVAVLNYGFWQRHFATDANVLGSNIQLDDTAYTIIGVLPRAMQYPNGTEILLPFAPAPAQFADRATHTYQVIGRLRSGATVQQAQSEMRVIANQLARAYPATNQGWTARVEPLLDTINGDLTPLYYKLIMGATLFVLLVVCANVANLQLARGLARQSEFAMRSALGASRRQIIRQLLTENIFLAVLGAGGGVAFAALYLKLILNTMPAQVARYIPGWYNTSINRRALLVSLALALGAGAAAALLPAVEALRLRIIDQLRAGSRQFTGRGRGRLRSIFAVAQISLAVALVIGAALMAKGMQAMLHQPDIYSPHKVLTLRITLPVKRYGTPNEQSAAYAAMLDRLRSLPGIDRAELTGALPYSEMGWTRDLSIENHPVAPGKIQSATYLPVSAGYLPAFHIPILSGREFNQGDSTDSVPVAIVSRRFVEHYLAGKNPLGRRIRMGNRNSSEPWLTIVGVADEASYSMWEEYRQPEVYVSAAQMPLSASTVALFTSRNPLEFAAPARKAIAAVDPGVPVDPVETYARLIHDDMIGLIDAAVMMGLDALIALLLSAIGIFGVMANVVGERTREIGVRLAMGARKQDVLAMVLRRSSWLTATGVGIGLVMAFLLARLVANLLRGVRPDDPLIFALVTGVIVAVALAASWLPARQAAQVDPIQALRAE